MGSTTRRRARTALWATLVVLAAVAALGALALYLAPRVLPNLETSLAESDTAQTVAADGVEAHVTVPAGWTSHRGWGGGDELVLRTPDGQLSVTVHTRALPTADAFAADAGEATLGAAATERLASGLETQHADDPDGGVFVAAVGMPGVAASAQIVARAPADRLSQYRAVLADILESVRVTA